MASWIEANPAQRLHQYTLPAARQEVAAAPAYVAELKAEIATSWAERSAQDVASYERRRATRRVKRLIAELRAHQRQVAWSEDLIAKHSR